MQLDHQIKEFISEVKSGAVEVYNEISLQVELGVFLRQQLSGCKVQFERNVSHFQLQESDFEKKEIDIAVISAESGAPLSAIELKYPRNGQFPESMFSFCKDIKFLEQLVDCGFPSTYFLVLADHPRFYSGNCNKIIYGYFRSGVPITGIIRKPTGPRDKEVNINGSYTASWHEVSGNTKFCLIRVGG
jgi:hypothetical protein